MGQNKNISPQAESIVSRRSTQKYPDSTCFVFWADSADPVFDWEQIPQTHFREISATAKGSSAKALTVKLPLAHNPKPICDFLRNLRETQSPESPPNGPECQPFFVLIKFRYNCDFLRNLRET